MKKYLYLSLSIVLILSILSGTRKSKSKIIKGTFLWQYTMEENEVLMIRKKDESVFGNEIKFKGLKFNDIRSAKCGNDILYNKSGSYFLYNNILDLNYTGGTFSDNVGGDSMQVYVKGHVYFTVKKFSEDTIQLFRFKGLSTKIVKRTKI